MEQTKSVRKTSPQQFTKLPTFLTGFVAGASAGALLSFYFDPRRGNYRRALLRDKIQGSTHRLYISGQRFLRNLSNRVWGRLAEIRHPLSTEVDDSKLVQRVRSQIGREISHPRAIKTTAQNGVITLSGPIFSDEVSKLMDCVRNVAGVKNVINQLEIHMPANGSGYLQ